MQINRWISNYNWSSGNDPKYIVIHDTGNFKDKARDNANYFNTGDRQALAHYFIDESETWQVVEDYNASWHCGDGRGQYGISNYNSIGIEMCNSGGFIAEATINNTLELVRDLMTKYNISADRVVRHYDASRKICPNNMSANNWALWKEFKSRIMDNNKTTGYVITNYLPNAWEGYTGVDINYVLSYFQGIKAYVRGNEKGIWIETQTLPMQTCLELKNTLGSWFYSIE